MTRKVGDGGARKPRISKRDLEAFLKTSVGNRDEEFELEEAIAILSSAISLLKSSTDHIAQEKIPEPDSCSEKHEKFLEMVRYRTVYNVVKYFVSGGIVGLATIVFFLYSTLYNPLHKAILRSQRMEQMLLENRKILKLMGVRSGWKIKEDGPGFKTPWEVQLDPKEPEEQK